MDLLDLYVSEVGKHLPLKSRRDIEAEIRSVLQDMLDERAQAAGHPVDEAMILDLLKEYGSPKKVAASYVPERYLIGPRFFPLFKLVLTVVASVMGALAIVGLGLDLARLDVPTTLAVLEAAGKAVLQYLTTMLQVLGNIVVVFVILEWAMPEFNEKLDDETDEAAWDPRTLLEIVPSDRVSIAGTIGEMVANLIAILLFNFYPQYIGFIPSAEGEWSFIPVLSEAFFRYLPALTALWGVEIILNLVLLLRGQWEKGTRWASIGTSLFGIGIGVAMLLGPSLVALTPDSLGAISAAAPDAAEILVTMAGTGVRLIIGLIIGLELLDVGKMIYWMVKNRRTPALA